MTQISRPFQDVSTGSWTPTPIAPIINPLVADDAPYVTSSNDPQMDTFECKLDALAFPSAGPQVLFVRMTGNFATTRPTATISLVQGTQVIATTQVRPIGGIFQTFSLPLTAQQIKQITNYADLRVRVSALCSEGTAGGSSSSSGSGSAGGGGGPCGSSPLCLVVLQTNNLWIAPALVQWGGRGKKGTSFAPRKLGKGESDVRSITETFRRNSTGNQSRLVELASSQKRVLRGAV